MFQRYTRTLATLALNALVCVAVILFTSCPPARASRQPSIDTWSPYGEKNFPATPVPVASNLKTVSEHELVRDLHIRTTADLEAASGRELLQGPGCAPAFKQGQCKAVKVAALRKVTCLPCAAVQHSYSGFIRW